MDKVQQMDFFSLINMARNVGYQTSLYNCNSAKCDKERQWDMLRHNNVHLQFLIKMYCLLQYKAEAVSAIIGLGLCNHFRYIPILPIH